MEHQPIGHDLEHCLHGENYQEHVFYLFLRAEREGQYLSEGRVRPGGCGRRLRLLLPEPRWNKEGP